MKALYLNNCLKSGEIPIPGPLSFNSDESGEVRTNQGEFISESNGAYDVICNSLRYSLDSDLFADC